MEKKKFDKRLLLLPLLPIPLLAAAGMRKKRKAKKQRAAVEALARKLVKERGGKKAAKKSGGILSLSRLKSLLGKRMFKFVMVAVLEKVIAGQRAKMKEPLPTTKLTRRLSKATDI